MNSTKDEEKYDIFHSKFDVEKHKQNYTNYLEVIIKPNGEVVYGIPSHQEAMIKIYCDENNVTRDELQDMIPQEYYCGVDVWLMRNTGCIEVWSEFYRFVSMTVEQSDKLTELIRNGLTTNQGERCW